MAKAFSGAPQFVKYFGPVLDALHQLGGSGRPDEVRSVIAQKLGLSEQEQSEPLPSKAQPRFDNQVHWARFYLTGEHCGPFPLVPRRRVSRHPIDQPLLSKPVKVTRKYQRLMLQSFSRPIVKKLRQSLQSLSANGFERFCQRLLRESGFQEVTITGRSGDGGIDGIGILQVNTLVSFKVLFQCKKYQGSVSPMQVRDFRGAMMGRADKGIIITTGSFTAEARKEAVRDGVPPIELVDGEKLIVMLEQLELGLKPRTIYEIDSEFFDRFQ